MCPRSHSQEVKEQGPNLNQILPPAAFMTALGLPLLETKRGFGVTMLGSFYVFPLYEMVKWVSLSFDLSLNSGFDPSVPDSSLYPDYLVHSRCSRTIITSFFWASVFSVIQWGS